MAKKRKKVNPVPAGYHTVTPYLACGEAAKAIEFYKKAFGAKEILRVPAPGGKIGHAEVQLGDSRVMLTDEYREMDFDKVIERAVAAGAKLIQPAQDKFYGDRTGSIKDPFGHVWHIATHIEDLSMAELKKRGEKAMKR